jgi:hypothetical protein
VVTAAVVLPVTPESTWDNINDGRGRKQTLWQHCGRGTRTSARHETSPLINADSDALIGATAAVQSLNTTYTKFGEIRLSRGYWREGTMDEQTARVNEDLETPRDRTPSTPERATAERDEAAPGRVLVTVVCACYRVHACTCQCAVPV